MQKGREYPQLPWRCLSRDMDPTHNAPRKIKIVGIVGFQDNFLVLQDWGESDEGIIDHSDETIFWDFAPRLIDGHAVHLYLKQQGQFNEPRITFKIECGGAGFGSSVQLRKWSPPQQPWGAPFFEAGLFEAETNTGDFFGFSGWSPIPVRYH